MAISWSGWVGSGFGRARVGIEVTWSGLTWTGRVYLTLGASSGDQVTLTRSGAWSGSTTLTHQDSSGSADKLIYTGSGTASAGQSLTFGVAMSGVWSGNNPSHSLTVTAPINPPAAPTGVTVSRMSDSSQKVDWSASSTTAAPIASQDVLRREFGKSSVSTVGAISNGTVRTFTDNTTVADRDYEYAVRVKNAAGSATSSWVRIQTTPAAPVSVSAARSGTDITVSIVPGTSIQCAHAVEHSADGGSSWVALGTIAAGDSTFTHLSPSTATTHTYRVRAVTPTNGLVSAWRQSNTVVLAAPPNAPSALTPRSAAVVAAGEDCVFSWQHNPVDTTPQTKFQIRHRKDGDAWTTESAVTSATSAWTLPADSYGVGDLVQWQVRTWGAHADPSPWSNTAVFAFLPRPTATINEPSSDIYAASLTTEWTFFSAVGATQAAYRAQLLQGGNVLETVSGTGAASSATFAHRLVDGETYTVTVELQDGLGLWSAADSVTFDVVYLPPASVSLDVSFDEDTGRVYISATPSDPVAGVTDTIDRIDIQRRIDGGEWVTILSGLAPDAFTFDAFAHTRGVSEYRAVSWSPIDAAANGPEASITVMSECSYLNWGPGRGSVARLLVGQTFSEKSSYEHTLVQFAANVYPTLMAGNARSRVLSVSAATVAGVTSSPFELHAATVAGTTVSWRDATGRRIERGALSGVSDSTSWAPLSSVSFDITHIA